MNVGEFNCHCAGTNDLLVEFAGQVGIDTPMQNFSDLCLVRFSGRLGHVTMNSAHAAARIKFVADVFRHVLGEISFKEAVEKLVSSAAAAAGLVG